jgi:hypothetical protein
VLLGFRSHQKMTSAQAKGTDPKGIQSEKARPSLIAEKARRKTGEKCKPRHSRGNELNRFVGQRIAPAVSARGERAASPGRGEARLVAALIDRGASGYLDFNGRPKLAIARPIRSSSRVANSSVGRTDAGNSGCVS